MFDPQHPSRGYALTWPRELLRGELSAVVNEFDDRDQRPALDLLFEEGLHGPDPREELTKIPDGPTISFDPWAPEPHASGEEPHENHCRAFGQQVLASVDDLPVHTARKYYLWRQETEPAGPGPTDLLALQREWTAIVEDLVGPLGRCWAYTRLVVPSARVTV